MIDRPRRAAALALTLSTILSTLPAVSRVAAAEGPSSGLLGFDAAGAKAERALEERFDAALDPALLRAWMKRLSAHPHHLGSPYGKENAEFLAGLFRQWGYDTAIEEFRVLFPTPRLRHLELVAPHRFVASLAEPPVPGDATSGQTREQLPVYNAYSIDGDVTGQLVYVNYGVPDDYEELARHGIEVRGKIVLARYGGSWRGIKPKVAAEHGAIGCILYSDPRGDGYFRGDVYPEGGYRNERSAQRGSVADMPLFPGDPLTPGVGATPGAKRLPLADAPTLTKIPVLPISYADARPLLAALAGPVAPEGWRGALPLTYHLGPGPAEVHLQVAFDWNQVPAYDVIAKLAGGERPDEWIVRGNHHDAWVNGATDPLSGLVALLAEARAVGELAKAGFRPKRTIVYAAWDGEEPGLLGSTEWAETHAAELTAKAAVYINSDSNSRGFFGVGGSHTLEPFINEVARDVPDPETGLSVAERLRARRILEGTPEERKAAREKPDLAISALGSGSDYTVFLQHLGIASLNLAFGGEGQYGQYHSAYDSFDHFLRFMDPDFAYGVALAKVGGRTVLRLADAAVLPLAPRSFATTVAGYAEEVHKLEDHLRDEAAERQRRLDDKLYQAVADPRETWLPPPPLSPVPYLNLAPLDNAVAHLETSAASFEKARGASDPTALPEARQAALDAALMATERALLAPSGLPRRPWFKHQVYAPGFYTGYGVKTLPGIREALEQRDWKEAEGEAVVVASALDAWAAKVDEATAIVAGKAAPAR